MEIMQRRCARNSLQRRQLSEMKSFYGRSYFVVILPLLVEYLEKHMQIAHGIMELQRTRQILLQSFHFREIVFKKVSSQNYSKLSILRPSVFITKILFDMFSRVLGRKIRCNRRKLHSATDGRISQRNKILWRCLCPPQFRLNYS